MNADFADKSSLPTALEGIEAVSLVGEPVPQLVELESNVIDACKQAGVRRIVLSSALGAARFNKSFPSWHVKVEEKLQASGLDYIIIRPDGFMQNIVASTRQVSVAIMPSTRRWGMPERA